MVFCWDSCLGPQLFLLKVCPWSSFWVMVHPISAFIKAWAIRSQLVDKFDGTAGFLQSYDNHFFNLLLTIEELSKNLLSSLLKCCVGESYSSSWWGRVGKSLLKDDCLVEKELLNSSLRPRKKYKCGPVVTKVLVWSVCLNLHI